MEPTQKFLHKFSGLSVWLEPHPQQTTPLTNEMKYLSHQCGGMDAGMAMFVPHCTLLYNTSLPSSLLSQNDDWESNGRRYVYQPEDQSQAEEKKSDDHEGEEWCERKVLGEKLLWQCLEEYERQRQRTNQHQGSPETIEREWCEHHKRTSDEPIKLKPTSHFYFPYPKKADNGKGFGCCISLLILESSPELMLFQEVVRGIFPPDERHASGDDNSERHDSDGLGENAENSNEPTENTGKANDDKIEKTKTRAGFRPHMALIYAPESQENVANGWLENYTMQMEGNKQYLDWTPLSLNSENVGNLESERCAQSLEGSQKMARNAPTEQDQITIETEKSSERHFVETEERSGAWDAKYLSLWSTEGTLEEWYPIVKIDLMPGL